MGVCWSKQGDATKHFKAMLGRYQIGQIITDSLDHADLAALVSIYDHDLPAGATTKTGNGITHFTKNHAGGPGFSTTCFYVHRNDGSKLDFSYIHAIRSAAKLSK